jgi:hypothetical protein
MPRLTIDALNNTVQVQDPDPVSGKVVIEAVPGTLKHTEVLWSQLQRMLPQLISLEQLGEVAFYVNEGDGDPRGAELGLIGLPSIGYFEEGSAAVSTVAATTDHILHGAGFLGGQVQSYVRLGDATNDDDAIIIHAIIPGPAGDDFTVEIEDNGGGATTFAAGASPTDLVISTDIGVNDYETLRDEINAAAGAGAYANSGVQVMAEYNGTPAGAGLTVVEPTTSLEGGAGPGLNLTVATVAGDITLVPRDGAQLRFDIDLTGGVPAAATLAGNIAVRASKVLAEINIPIV